MQTVAQQTNILDEILCATEEQLANSGQEEDLAALLYLYSIPSTRRGKRQKKTVGKTRIKKKVTAYFSRKVFDGLEKVRSEMLLLFPEMKKNTFSRSNLLDTTVALLLKEFSDKKNHERLLEQLLNER